MAVDLRSSFDEPEPYIVGVEVVAGEVRDPNDYEYQQYLYANGIRPETELDFG